MRAPDQEQLSALSCYGEHIGLAFQIVDDVLDVEQSSADAGQNGRQGRTTAQDHLSRPCTDCERSREMAEEERLAAHLALRPFDDRAERLRELADFIVHRRA